MSTRRTNPDPVGLAIAREMQELLRPMKVILQGSRAAGDHQQDSGADLIAVCLDEKVVRKADETLRQLLQGKYDIPVVNVITTTEEEFRFSESYRTVFQSTTHIDCPNRRGSHTCILISRTPKRPYCLFTR